MSENIFISIKYIYIPLQVNEQTRAENGETAVIWASCSAFCVILLHRQSQCSDDIFLYGASMRAQGKGAGCRRNEEKVWK